MNIAVHFSVVSTGTIARLDINRTPRAWLLIHLNPSMTDRKSSGHIKSFLRAASGWNVEARWLHFNNPYDVGAVVVQHEVDVSSLVDMLTKKTSSSKRCGARLEMIVERTLVKSPERP